MTHPNARHKEIERDARRAKVAKLLLGGVTNQADIAAQLDVDQSTISRDIKVIEAEWRERAAEDIAKAKGKDLARAERLIQALWPAAIKGTWLATDRVLALMQHRAKLLGLEAPIKQEHSGPNGGPLQIQSIEVVLDGGTAPLAVIVEEAE